MWYEYVINYVRKIRIDHMVCEECCEKDKDR